MAWWIRPLVRILAALLLPFIVPAIIIAILWALPGDPATNLCPENSCTQAARDELVARFHLTSPPAFYVAWLASALVGDFGKSITAFQGEQVSALVWVALPQTAMLLLIALVPILIGSAAAAFGYVPRRADPVLQVIGLAPAVILSLLALAIVVINYGPLSYEGWPYTLRLLLGGLVLGIADSALASAVVGTRSVFEQEEQQRYMGIALLRGESSLLNALPNVLPALVGQLRGRVLHLLSGAVIVEVVVGIDGLGDLLWRGTLNQDFFVVLAATWGFAILSTFLLLFQAVIEVGVAFQVRRSPTVPA